MIAIPADTNEVLFRLGIATLIGCAIGLNRHLHDQPAGLRTHGLVGLGSALAMLVFAPTSADVDQWVDAQARVLQGIVTGIGFLGAGVILHGPKGHKIHGLTTAAAIWLTATFGALCGRGHIAIALYGFAIVLVVLMFGAPVEKLAVRVFGRKHADDREAVREPTASDESVR
ncbi:MAG TPA: MgtC/SapB family protein [Rudaea sp.]